MVTLYEGGQTQELVEYPFVNLQNEVNINVMIKDKPVRQVRAQVREKREEGARKARGKCKERVARVSSPVRSPHACFRSPEKRVETDC